MQVIAQVVELDTGRRTDIMKAERHELAKAFSQSFVGENESKLDNHAVLVLIDDVKENWDFSKAPMMTVRRYMELFLQESHDNGREEV